MMSAPHGAYYHANIFLLGPLTGNHDVRMGFMVLPVRPTPIRFPINILYTPVPFHFMLNINRNSLSLANIVRSVIWLLDIQ